MKKIQTIILAAVALGVANFADAKKVPSQITKKGDSYYFVNQVGELTKLPEKPMTKNGDLIKRAAKTGEVVTVYVGTKGINKVLED